MKRRAEVMRLSKKLNSVLLWSRAGCLAALKMMDMKMVKDPLGNEVFIKEAILLSNKRIMKSEELLDDISTVIEKPMMILKMKRDAAQFYYLRAVGWNKTMLLSVHQTKGHFEVINCEIDPPLQRFSELYGNAERLV